MRKSFLLIIVTLIIFGIACANYYQPETKPTLIVSPPQDTMIFIPDTIKTDTIPLSFKDSLFLAMDEYGIHHQDIVYVQAVLETGHFTSKLSKKGNLFGLRGRRGYMTFNHWKESVKFYADRIQSRYREGEDYFEFLKRIHYAESPTYISYLKKLLKNHGKTKQK